MKTGFWSGTEGAFYRQLETRIGAARDAQEFDRFLAAEQWLALLKQAVMKLFDEVFVGAGAIERQHPRRSAQARRKLLAGLHGNKLRESLGLPVADAAAQKAKQLSQKPDKKQRQEPAPPPLTGANGAQLSLELS